MRRSIDIERHHGTRVYFKGPSALTRMSIGFRMVAAALAAEKP